MSPSITFFSNSTDELSTELRGTYTVHARPGEPASQLARFKFGPSCLSSHVQFLHCRQRRCAPLGLDSCPHLLGDCLIALGRRCRISLKQCRVCHLLRVFFGIARSLNTSVRASLPVLSPYAAAQPLLPLVRYRISDDAHVRLVLYPHKKTCSFATGGDNMQHLLLSCVPVS